MANDKRGEVEINVSGMVHTIRPSFQALRSIEHRTNYGLVMLIRQVATLTITYENLVIILQEALKDIGAPYTEEQIGQAVIDQSMTDFVEPLSKYLGSIISQEKIELPSNVKKMVGEAQKH